MRGVLSAIAVLGFGLVPLAASASGGPVYLTCTLDAKPDWIMDVQLNEQSGSASIHYRHGGSGAITRRAAFAPDRISFERYVVSRTDLRFSKDNRRDTWASVMNLPPMEYGQCVIDDRERSI